MSNNEEKLYKLAQKKVKKKKGFYRHLQAFVMVNVALLFIGFMEGDFLGGPFPVTVFWGIGLGFHYANVFGLPGGKLTDEWEDRELEKEYKKLKNRFGSNPKDLNRNRKDELDMDDHLDLKQPQKMKDYEDRDFV